MKSLSLFPSVALTAAAAAAAGAFGSLNMAMRAIGGGNASTTRGFNRLSQKSKRRRARQQRSQSFNRSK